MRSFSLIAATVAALTIGGGAVTAQPAFNTSGENIVAQQLCNPLDTTPAAIACRGVFNAGNVSSDPDDFSNNIDLNVDFFSQDGTLFETGLFGDDDWDLLARSTGGASDGLSYSVLNGVLSWNFATNVSMFEHVVFGFKQSTESAFYKFDARSAPATGTMDLSRFTNPGISNMTAWARGTSGGGGNLDVVPLPAAGWLLLAGVGGLAAMARRRKAAA